MLTTDLRSMGEKEARKNVRLPSINLRGFLSQFPGKFQRHLKSRFKRPIEKEGTNRDMFKLNDAKFSLEKQVQAWRKNPVWDDDQHQPPGIEVIVPKGSLCQLNVKANVGLPPDAIYNIVTDPDNRRVFKNIQEVVSRKVLLDEGSRQIVELEQAAIWRFLWWSGTISVHVLVDQNRDDYSVRNILIYQLDRLFIVNNWQMKFKQVKPGFMKRFEGSWRVEPVLVDENLCHPFKPKSLSEYMSRTQGNGRIGSTVSLQQLVEPAIVPPPPISWYLRGITSRTVEMLINDLVDEAARIKGVTKELSLSDERKLDQILDIKERWALRRRRPRKMM